MRLSKRGMLSSWLLTALFFYDKMRPSHSFGLGRKHPLLHHRYMNTLWSVSSPIEKDKAVPRMSPAAQSLHDLNLLLVDHYDSFTYNLVDLIAQSTRQPPTVVAWDALNEGIIQNLQNYDGIILSPGPGSPSDYSKTLKLIQSQRQQDNKTKKPMIPILGVCLGHQMIAHVYNATVKPSLEPIHGQIWECFRVDNQHHQIKHQNVSHGSESSKLFQNVSDQFQATRYHSLQVVINDPTIPLRVTTVAYHNDNSSSRDHPNNNSQVVMALESTTHPHYGVQFHPESIGSLESVGRTLINNFLAICSSHQATREASRPTKERQRTFANAIPSIKPQQTVATTTLQKPTVYVHQVLNCTLTPEQVMLLLYRDGPFSYWLDHASPVPSDNDCSNSRIVSILGSSVERVEYWNGGDDDDENKRQRFILEYQTQGSNTLPTVHRMDDVGILDYLSQQHCVDRQIDSYKMVKFDSASTPVMTEHSEQDDTLPFDFRGGHVGYLGYEVRFDTLQYLQLEEGFCNEDNRNPAERPTKSDPNVPTAAFLFASKSCVYHHATQTWYLVSVARDKQEDAEALEWMRITLKRLISHEKTTQISRSRLDVTYSRQLTASASPPIPTTKLSIVPNRSRSTYSNDFRNCMEYIRLGESYELCLTNQLEATIRTEQSYCPLSLYRILRQANPAPHAAYFNWNCLQSVSDSKGSLAICCSSPERFVSARRMADGKLLVETKPIKGTRARVMPSDSFERTDAEAHEDTRRAEDLRTSVKDRAENLMIVDLLRNDFSRVCESGTVHVPKMMEIESYATVHQMVSTIRGVLDPSSSTAVDLLKACFPGGSMTGAPKVRSMELLNELEENVSRGPYSGSLGYISLNGCADMNIIIRSAVVSPHSRDQTKISVGSGGAITALSEDADEYDEMMLKAAAVIKAVEDWTIKCSSKELLDVAL
jgi:para-aminobenzoate synthetase